MPQRPDAGTHGAFAIANETPQKGDPSFAMALRRGDPTCRYPMKTNAVVASASALVALLSCSCATSPPPDFAGRWTPVNHYAAAPEAIALAQPYVFTPTPLDRTLKTMLSRWATDSSRTLLYQHPSDFALYGPVANIHTSRMQDALAMLNALYREQRVDIELDGDAIVVRQRDAAPVAITPQQDAPMH